MLKDSAQRAQATEPTQSFIVQAPAGSGKTEILTQRYLRLLSTVHAPEQILALTFTRKAANEMRERILHAMQRVVARIEPVSEHQQTTHAYAQAALAQDTLFNWQLLQQPSRLKVITIDSLCQTLTQAIPLQEKQIHYAQISDKPQIHYIKAARACLAFLIDNPDYHTAITTILLHLDNQQDHLLELFTVLLANRDQWLNILYQAKTQDKAVYEQAIQYIEQHELLRFRETMSYEQRYQLIQLSKQLACIENQPSSPRYALCNWQSFDELDGELATSLAALLLTSQNTLRKAFDHHVGLKRGVCPDQDYDALKAASKQLLAELNELPDFLERLLRIKSLPTPQYDSEQWDVLQAIFTVLPILAAHLNLVFAEHNEVDFSAISQQALQAMGEEDSPTDLALYLDNRIHHILIDEFQDTSIQQYQLLEKLIYGWQPNDGKTLFVVGDPMQSIYRFRSAEVGLFLKAREQGIGQVDLIPLELSCNFRSTDVIVAWVNKHFKSIFPSQNDIESGAVTFSASTNVKTADEYSRVQAFQYSTPEQEAEAIVGLVVDELEAHPQDNIAILVRTRTQLSHIVRVLRTQNIPFQGIEIDLLAKLPHLRDVWIITQALLMPAHRLAWLAVLRSPWCGLPLSDLHCIANYAKSKSIYFALSQLEEITGLSDNGRTRAQFVYSVFDRALSLRHQHPLVDWIMSTLQSLHLNQILTATQRDDLEQYWLLLERFEKQGHIEDIALFKKQFNALYSKKVTPSRLQIMTIHKSKGLEFDCVILPGLSNKASNRDAPLLRWFTLPSREQGELLLVSPIKAIHHEQCLLYDYLGTLDTQKDHYELQRLFYVAATRAKKRLYLFDRKAAGSQGSFRSMLVHQEFLDSDDLPQSPESEQSTQTKAFPALYQLPLSYYQAPSSVTPKLAHDDGHQVAKITLHNIPRLTGIVAHELLQWICNHHPTTINDIPWTLAHYSLTQMGLVNAELDTAMQALKQQVTSLFNHPIGQWIIKPHAMERNEWELLASEQGEVVTRIIDRTFMDNGIRWIIDFKTGREDHETQTKHQKQVEEYAKLLSYSTSEPIRCGLYYLTHETWIDWDYCELQ